MTSRLRTKQARYGAALRHVPDKHWQWYLSKACLSKMYENRSIHCKQYWIIKLTPLGITSDTNRVGVSVKSLLTSRSPLLCN